MKTRKMVEKDYTWEEVGDIIASGKAQEIFGFGEIDVEVDDVGTAVLEILDFDKDKSAENPDAHTMTVWFTDLVFDPMPFNSEGKNKWEESDVRKYINSMEFKEKFEEGFRKLLTPTMKGNGKDQDTLDTFFLLSKDEVDGEKRYKRLKTEKDGVKVNRNGGTGWHWLRSAYRGCASDTWYVSPSGDVYSTHATRAYRFAPACVLSK